MQMRRIPTLAFVFFAFGLAGSVATGARADHAPAKAAELLIRATQGAVSGGGCDGSFLSEYVQMVADQLSSEAPRAYVLALRGLKSRPERACLRETLRSLGLDPGSR